MVDSRRKAPANQPLFYILYLLGVLLVGLRIAGMLLLFRLVLVGAYCLLALWSRVCRLGCPFSTRFGCA